MTAHPSCAALRRPSVELTDEAVEVLARLNTGTVAWDAMPKRQRQEFCETSRTLLLEVLPHLRIKS